MTTQPTMRTCTTCQQDRCKHCGHGTGKGSTGTIRHSRDGVRIGRSGNKTDLVTGAMGDLEMSHCDTDSVVLLSALYYTNRSINTETLT